MNDGLSNIKIDYKGDNDMFIEEIKTEKDFDKYVEWLERQNLPSDIDYELYNQAFKQLYGHSAFDEQDKIKNKRR